MIDSLWPHIRATLGPAGVNKVEGERKGLRRGRVESTTSEKYQRENEISLVVYSVGSLRNTSPCEERSEGGRAFEIRPSR